MPLLNKILHAATANRLRQIDHFRRNPTEVQNAQIDCLLSESSGCNYLASRGVTNLSEFTQNVPVVGYEELAVEIDKIIQGEQNVLWSTKTKWFAKSSGTTNDKSKYIPITNESLQNCHYRGGKDLIAIFNDNFPNSKAFTGKSLTLGGSHKMVSETSGILCGDLSAILIENVPQWFSLKRVPSRETALTPDFEEKVEKICHETVGQNVTNFAGAPSWNLVLMNRLLEFTGKNNILEIWPDMSLFAHGGINFAPYREQYKRLFPSPEMVYNETYNASEGFFAIQDDPTDESMLLMLDYGIYYEFLPVSDLQNHSATIPLEGVKTGVNYAMIISTNGGLWRYMIGDTVEFTSLDPYKIRITGRTKHFINAFGEEIIIDNAERAMNAACAATGAIVQDYTAAPVYMEGDRKGCHQWLIEFQQNPTSVELFAETLDKTLQSVNSDYEAKRTKNSTLERPIITEIPQGAFFRWMTSRGKVGGQNKIPRLSNDRAIVESILDMLKSGSM